MKKHVMMIDVDDVLCFFADALLAFHELSSDKLLSRDINLDHLDPDKYKSYSMQDLLQRHDLKGIDILHPLRYHMANTDLVRPTPLVSWLKKLMKECPWTDFVLVTNRDWINADNDPNLAYTITLEWLRNVGIDVEAKNFTLIINSHVGSAKSDVMKRLYEGEDWVLTGIVEDSWDNILDLVTNCPTKDTQGFHQTQIVLSVRPWNAHRLNEYCFKKEIAKKRVDLLMNQININGKLFFIHTYNIGGILNVESLPRL